MQSRVKPPFPNPPTDQESPALFDDTGTLRSRLYADLYFSTEDGLSESRAVFLDGCGLPAAWAGRDRFTVLELGFGTGLNLAALIDLWRRSRTPGQRLNIFTLEAHPLPRQVAGRALAAFPEIADSADILLSAWPPQVRGSWRIDRPDLGLIIDVRIGEALEALSTWSGRADAVFLDGFAPAVNPDMWRDAVMDALAARLAPGARLASFTVAGAVRRALEARGLRVRRAPGFGRKRHRLEAAAPGEADKTLAPPRVAIVGEGLAGAALARAFRVLGVEPVVIAPEDPDLASGQPAGLLTPRLDAGGGAVSRLYAQAFLRAVSLVEREAPEAILARGVAQLEATARDIQRFDRLAEQEIWPDGALRRLSVAAVRDIFGAPAPVTAQAGGLWMETALSVDPRILRRIWIAEALLLRGRVAEITRQEGALICRGVDGETLHEADIVVIAAGWRTPDLWAAPIIPVRGQASLALGLDIAAGVAWGGYAVPAAGGVLFGATHDRGVTEVDARQNDDARNLDTLARVLPALAEAAGAVALAGKAGIRATTRDRLPICGSLGPSLWCLTGLGSRGLTLAPLLAEHVAALALGAPSPLPTDLADRLSASRFSAGEA